MDSVYEELDESRAEIQRLKEQYRAKAELAESLKRSHHEQLIKVKEVNYELEKLSHELNVKEQEISVANQTNEELRSSLNDKEAAIKHLISTNDKLRLDWTEKLRQCEDENKKLILALSESTAKNVDKEQQLSALTEQIETLKRILDVTKKKLSEAENKLKASKGLQQRDDDLFNLEEENRQFKDQLKWKKEQFSHLEEAHEKLRHQLKTKENEWENEKGALFEEISSLQTNLESQISISEDLQRRLDMCKLALAHEESKRKSLQVQLLESSTSFDNVCAETSHKEMEYQLWKLEREKQEMMVSVKELHEAQILEAEKHSSSSKLQDKLKHLVKVHAECSTNLRTKEATWHSQIEKLTSDLNFCMSALESKDASMNMLKKELEACHCLITQLELQNEEASLMLLVLRSEISEAEIMVANNNSGMNLVTVDFEGKISTLVEQLEMKKAALSRAQNDLQEEREKVAVLSRRVKSIEDEQFPLRNELDRLKQLLAESSTSRLCLEEQVLHIQRDLEQVHDALDKANDDLYEKLCEVNEVEFEMQMWKAIAEQLKVNLEENWQMRRRVEASLLEQIEIEVNLKQERANLSHLLEEKDKRVDDLQQQLAGLNEKIGARENASPARLKDTLHQLVEEKDQRINDLQQHVASLEQEFQSTTSSFSSQLSNTQAEKKSLHQLVEEKDQIIYKLHELLALLEQEFESATSCFFSQLAGMQPEKNLLPEYVEVIKTGYVLKEMEIQEKNLMIIELENDLSNLQHALDQQERTLFSSEKKREEIGAELDATQQEIYKLEHELESRVNSSNVIIKKLSEEKMKLHTDFIKLSSDNEYLLSTMGLLHDRIQQLSIKDMQLMEHLGRIVQTPNNDGAETGLNNDDEHDPVKENLNFCSSPLIKKSETIPDTDDRLPLRALNN